jgi:DNA polymerase (family 10)
MDNYEIYTLLGLYAKLAELHEENPFRTKAFAAAAFNLKKVKEPLAAMAPEDLAKVPGMGKSILATVQKLLSSGTFPELEEITEKTPAGIVEMLSIKGLGPKKVGIIWRNMGLETVEELFDACRENRLVEQPGFGYKTQGEIMHAIQFSMNAKGHFHFARADAPAHDLLEIIRKTLPDMRTELTGEFRRCCETLERIEFITTADPAQLSAVLLSLGLTAENTERYKDVSGFTYFFNFSTAENFDVEWFCTTGNAEHLREIGFVKENVQHQKESEIYNSLQLPYIVPEMREGIGESKWKAEGKLLEFSDLKGTLHNHTNYSDGLNTLREMAVHAKNLGLEYLAVCDHSKSAGYANGLNEERVLQQFAEIDNLNKELAPFRIYKGIESDILGDGSLDYSEDLLAQFDLVVASVHSNLKMNEEKAMLRLTRAIENPYTRILGHPTGRLLLVRNGYPIDHRYIIDACAANNVVIELNANPYRLDLDWRWIPYAMEKGVKIAINPDAHEKEGYHDMYYGTLAARKGGLSTSMTLNALAMDEFDEWVRAKRNIAVA